jgi:hypothetical protein
MAAKTMTIQLTIGQILRPEFQGAFRRLCNQLGFRPGVGAALAHTALMLEAAQQAHTHKVCALMESHGGVGSAAGAIAHLREQISKERNRPLMLKDEAGEAKITASIRAMEAEIEKLRATQDWSLSRDLPEWRDFEGEVQKLLQGLVFTALSGPVELPDVPLALTTRDMIELNQAGMIDIGVSREKFTHPIGS